ncbi:MAG: hypothetical protein QMB00_07380, partial [Candidatus Nanopelagicales bacterium]
TPCPPVKCRLFVGVRGCSEIAPIQGFEQQRTSADSALVGRHMEDPQGSDPLVRGTFRFGC